MSEAENTPIPEGQWKVFQQIRTEGARSGKPLMEYLQGEIIRAQTKDIDELEARVKELEEDKELDAAAREQLREENQRLIRQLNNLQITSGVRP